jgi:hypothetical protein
MLVVSLLDGTVYGTSWRVRDLVGRGFWDEADPGWRTPARISRPLAPFVLVHTPLAPGLKSWLDSVIVPALVLEHLATVRN